MASDNGTATSAAAVSRLALGQAQDRIRLVAGALHHTGSERVFVTMYGLNLLAIRVAGHGLDAYARRGHLYSPDVEGAELQSQRRDLLTTVAGYVVAILIGLALPTVSVAVYFGLALYLVWPFRGLHISLSRLRSSRR